MAGRTTRYAIEPRGEYVFGVVAGQPMRSRRGRERRLVRPGQLVAWDPSQRARRRRRRRPAMVVSPDGRRGRRPGRARGATTSPTSLADVAFPEPVLSDPELAARSCACTPRSRLSAHAARARRAARGVAARADRALLGTAARPARRSVPATTGRCAWPATTSATGPSATSASTNSPPPPASASSASSGSSASAPACHPTRCRSPTASAPPAACSKPARRSPRPPPPPASPTRATCTATSSAASGSPRREYQTPLQRLTEPSRSPRPLRATKPTIRSSPGTHRRLGRLQAGLRDAHSIRAHDPVCAQRRLRPRRSPGRSGDVGPACRRRGRLPRGRCGVQCIFTRVGRLMESSRLLPTFTMPWSRRFAPPSRTWRSLARLRRTSISARRATGSRRSGHGRARPRRLAQPRRARSDRARSRADRSRHRDRGRGVHARRRRRAARRALGVRGPPRARRGDLRTRRPRGGRARARDRARVSDLGRPRLWHGDARANWGSSTLASLPATTCASDWRTRSSAAMADRRLPTPAKSRNS